MVASNSHSAEGTVYRNCQASKTNRHADLLHLNINRASVTIKWLGRAPAHLFTAKLHVGIMWGRQKRKTPPYVSVNGWNCAKEHIF